MDAYDIYHLFYRGKIKGVCFLRHHTEHLHFLDFDERDMMHVDKTDNSILAIYDRVITDIQNKHLNKKIKNDKVIRICKQYSSSLHHDDFNMVDKTKQICDKVNRNALRTLFSYNSFNNLLINNLLDEIDNLKQEVKNEKNKTKEIFNDRTTTTFDIRTAINNN